MRVLVCGGRDYDDSDAVSAALDRMHADHGVDLVIHGACKDRKTGRLVGADRWAQLWAFRRDIPYLGHPARWNDQDNAAGPIRNAAMLKLYRPHVVLAFPGGKGTRNMMGLARAAGVEVIEAAPAAGKGD